MNSKFSKIIIFLFLCLPVLASQDIKIITSNSNSIVIEYTPVIVDTSAVTINGIQYINFGLKNIVFENNDKPGLPQIPVKLINIGVPSEFGNTIQILNSSYKTIDGKVVPSITPVEKSNGINYEHIVGENYNEYKSNELVTFDDFGIVRDLAVQTIKISPVQFDPLSNKIKFYNRIVFKINFASGNNNPVNDKYLKHVVINYDAAKNWGIKKKSLEKTNAVNSVLAQGTWYKFRTPDEGIYKITRSQLAGLGIDAANVDPRTIKIYNNGGYVLPEDPTANTPTDLVENAILVVGQEDGRFDENDYILFYGRGIDFWEYNTLSKKVIRNKHWYTKNNYYWITSGGAEGKRIENKNSLNEPSFYNQTSTQAFAFVDKDSVNLIKSGRVYFGDKFDSSNDSQNESKTYINTLNNILQGSEIEYSFTFGNSATTSLSLKMYENNNLFFSQNISGASGRYEAVRLTSRTVKFATTLPDDRSVLKINFDTRPNTSDAGYLDFVELRYNKSLTAAMDQLLFFSKDTSSVINYELSNFSNSDIHVFDVTEYSTVKKIANANVSGGQFIFRSEEISGKVSKYFAVNSSAFKQIQNIERADNSNIHGILPGAEYVIITDKTFSEQALRLKEYRKSNNNYSVEIVYLDEIVNEFSGGLTDPTAIRNFLKYAYGNWTEKPFYVLLFGDGHYDILQKEGNYPIYVYTYQSLNSYEGVSTFTTDDYFGRIIGADRKIDVTLGRLNVNSKEEANIVVDKIINYEQNISKGTWTNTVTLVADDNVTSDGIETLPHTRQSETLANESVPKSFDIKKIYLAEYPTVISGLGRKKPTATDALVSVINTGTLMVNYQGHGSEDLWADEEVFNRATTIPRLNNERLFFLSAPTCDFAYFDKPGVISGAEELLLLENKGMIGGFVSSRPVFSAPNAALNEAFYSNLFPGNSSTHEARTIGEAYFITKQIFDGTNDEKFTLMADPALMLNFPNVPVSIDSINGNTADGSPIQIKALSTVSVSGSVKNSNGDVDNSFEGEGFVTVFDAEKQKYIKDLNETVVKQGGVIFNGRVSIENGNFRTEFVVPKDITYENKNGKIVAYVFNDDTDGIGFTTNVIVGGTDTTVVNDNKGPEAEIYYDNINFENSFLVNPDFKLIVKLTDETGLNTTGTGVGHKLEAILNEDVENTIDLSSNFTGDLNSGGKSGLIEYNFFDKEPGNYNIKIKAWDVFNNPSETESFFTVVNDASLVLRNVVNYPNPFSSSTTFTFQQNLDKPLNIKIKIYTIAGRLIKEIEENNILEKFVKIPWDGRDEDGSILANGTYLYKLIVETVDSQYKENILGKLAIIK